MQLAASRRPKRGVDRLFAEVSVIARPFFDHAGFRLNADTSGLVVDGPARVYVEQLEWWQYYPNHVLGKARGGLFIFEESTEKVHYINSEDELSNELRRRRLGQPCLRVGRQRTDGVRLGCL